MRQAQSASDMYGLSSWGAGYFHANEAGHLAVTPFGDADPTRAIDLYEVIEGLDLRGIATPVLLRFPDLLKQRMKSIRNAFDDAMKAEEYTGGYACVYPIKVNQQRQLVEHIRDFGAELGFGLEAGSKPELLAVLGLTAGLEDMPIVCNGFKDEEYVETVILAHKLGRSIVPVVESFHELRLIIRLASRYGVRPTIGVRVKPSATGAGRWAESGGERSKFGLHAPELLSALELLKAEGMADCLKLIHFHVGSQMCDIRQVKNAVSELARTYVELRRLGAGLEMIDIGGGLAVDYDGSNSTWASSMNYSLDEYARDVVYRIARVCEEAGQPHPRIISESGRALVAHSSVLVFDIVGKSRFRSDPDTAWIKRLMAAETDADREIPQPVHDLLDAWERMRDANDMDDGAAAEAFHDAQQARGEALSLFGLGYLSLPMRAVAERLFWAIGRRVLALTADSEAGGLPDQIGDLPRQLSDIYFCNFSLFQSLPDSWAIDQIFPIMPIHRLNETPTRRAMLADITCDSDGQIDRFASPDQRDYHDTLPVHEIRRDADGSMAEPYHMAAFLVGAYQEVLGDLHNLFGDTHCVHVSLDDDGGWQIEELIEGDTVREVLSYVQYDVDGLRSTIRRETERAVKRGRMSVQESQSLRRFFDSGLQGYTYLE